MSQGPHKELHRFLRLNEYVKSWINWGLTDSSDLHGNSTDVESYLWVGKCKDRMCWIFDLQNWVGFCSCSNMSKLQLIELTDSTDLHGNSTNVESYLWVVNAKIECVAYSIVKLSWRLRLFEIKQLSDRFWIKLPKTKRAR